MDFGEDTFAVAIFAPFAEELDAEEFGSHGVGCGVGLEPAEFGAHLEVPGSCASAVLAELWESYMANVALLR